MLINIQILRGLAALWVFFHHTWSHFLDMGLRSVFFETFASLGYIGVDVFFVISGLVISKSTENLNPSKTAAVGFLKKRLFRVYLGYWPIFILTLIVFYYISPEKLLAANAIQSALLAGIYMESLLIPQAWSLPFELYFYILIAMTIFFKFRNYHLLVFVLIVLISLKVNLIEYRENELLDLILTPMLAEFFMGFYLWRYRKFLIHNKYLVLYLLLAAVTLYFAVNFYLVATSFRGLVFGIFSSSLVAVLLILEGRIPQPIITVFKPIGDSSYTLYLLHYLLLISFVELGMREWFKESNYPLLGFVLMVFSVVLISYVFYKLIEKPLYERSTKQYRKKLKESI